MIHLVRFYFKDVNQFLGFTKGNKVMKVVRLGTGVAKFQHEDKHRWFIDVDRESISVPDGWYIGIPSYFCCENYECDENYNILF